MKNHTKLRKHRVVGMAEFNRFAVSIQAVTQFAASAEGIARGGNDIMLTATSAGDIGWRQRFGLDTLATLTEQRRPLDLEFQAATLAFTGEKHHEAETAQEFFERIAGVFLDDAKLGAMMARNNITFIGVGS